RRGGGDLRGWIDRLAPGGVGPDPGRRAERAQQAAAPRHAAGHVDRPALLDRLDRWARRGGRPLLLAGPAGTGKTALLCCWVARADAAAPAAGWRGPARPGSG